MNPAENYSADSRIEPLLMTQIMSRQFSCPVTLRPCLILEFLPGLSFSEND